MGDMFPVDITSSERYRESMIRIRTYLTTAIYRNPELEARPFNFFRLPSMDDERKCFVCEVKTMQHTLSLLFVSSNLYFVGFKSDTEKEWTILDTKSKQLEALLLDYIRRYTPERRYPLQGTDYIKSTIEVNYNYLEKERNRSTLSLGLEPLISAVNNMQSVRQQKQKKRSVRQGKQKIGPVRQRNPQIEGCILFIQMFSEALRFNILFARIVNHFDDPVTINDEIKNLEIHWKKISYILYDYATGSHAINLEENANIDGTSVFRLGRLRDVVSAILVTQR